MGKERPQEEKVSLVRHACERISAGESLRAVCRSEGMPSAPTILRWIEEDETGDLAEQYTRAMEARADALFDELFEIADGGTDDVQRDRLSVDTRKWALARMSPKKYGEKLALDHSGRLKVEGIKVTFVGTDATDA